MLSLTAILPVVLPVLLLFVPGVFLVKWPNRLINVPMAAVRMVLWSVGILVVSSLLMSFFGWPLWLYLPVVTLSGLVWMLRRGVAFTRKKIFLTSLIPVSFLFVYAAFSIPYLFIHDGLPTGDSQKAIYWAEYINDNDRLPDYDLSVRRLGRDPVDFYTPGLHGMTAVLMSLVPEDDLDIFAYMSVGFMSIAVAVAVALAAGNIGMQITGKKYKLPVFLLTVLLVLTNFRFLRYLREPGYHYQNVVGELLLFGLLFVFLSLLHKWRTSNFVLSLLLLFSLFFVHQFSVFLAAFSLFPVAILFVYKYRRWLIEFLSARNYLGWFSLFTFIAMGILFGRRLGLMEKLPHIFNSDPHLISFTPNLIDYPNIIGTFWVGFGLSGLVALARVWWAKKKTLVKPAFVAAALVLLLLSQGPRVFIDIPPVRALLYAAVPLSIAAAYMAVVIACWANGRRFVYKLSVYILVLAALVSSSYFSTARAYDLSHEVRVNSTLQASHLPVIEYLENLGHRHDDGILIDDYNRRSASWFLLSDTPTFSRLSSNLKKAMDEAKQSELRRKLYLNGLDYEKMYALGSKEIIGKLMSRNNVSFVTGIEGTSNMAFANNQALREVTRGGDLILYELSDEFCFSCNYIETSSEKWLLRASTIANDIGDKEDTFAHLPVSLSATRLSGPRVDSDGVTYRSTTAPLIPLVFNVNDYVSYLWDKDGSGYPDVSLKLMIKTIDGRDLRVELPDGEIVSVTGDGTEVTVGASHANLKDNDLLKFIILNPEERKIDIDMVAIGLSRVP